VKALKGILPDAFIEMATEVDLHDAEFLEVRLDRKSGRLRLLLKAWLMKQRKWRRIRLDYRNAAISPGSKAFFRRLMNRKRKGTVTADEGDVSASGLCEHRLLCFPHGELVIQGSDFRYAWIG
jgi:hypothetical protein